MPKKSKKDIQTAFLRKLKGADLIIKLFDNIPDSFVFVKDDKGRHLMTSTLLAEQHSKTTNDIFGKKSEDFCDPRWAKKYQIDDQFVLKSGKPIKNRKERILTSEGMKWFSTTKSPLHNNKGDVIGLVGVSHNIENEMALMRQIKRQQKQLEELTKKDSLTGCYNQRYIKEDLSNRMLSLQRSGNRKMAVLMFDLDNFKDINDSFGHLGGDKVLIKFCDQIRLTLRRQSDSIIRLGGDEFMVTLFGTDKKGAIHMAKKMQESLTQIKWNEPEFKGRTFSLKTSVGVTNLKKGESMEDLLKRADQALYAAKSKGRDRIEYRSALKSKS